MKRKGSWGCVDPRKRAQTIRLRFELLTLNGQYRCFQDLAGRGAIPQDAHLADIPLWVGLHEIAHCIYRQDDTIPELPDGEIEKWCDEWANDNFQMAKREAWSVPHIFSERVGFGYAK